MKFDTIIFDLDGVLCHTDKYHYRAWKIIADDLGIPFDEQVNNRLRGVSRRISLEIILEAYPNSISEEEKSELAERKNAIYREHLKGMTPSDIDDSVFALLDALRAKGIPMAIGSSSKNAPLILEKTRLSEYFAVVVDGNQIKESKPNPEVFLLAAKLLKAPPGRCLVIEDAAAGIKAAHAAGMKAVGIGAPGSLPFADVTIESLREFSINDVMNKLDSAL